MKKILSTSLLFILAFVSFNTYAQVKEESSNESTKTEVIVRERDKARAEARTFFHDDERSSSHALSTYTYGDGVFVVNGSGSSSSQLSLSKSFDGESKKNEGSFEVEESVRNISLNLNGEVKSGEIKIKISLPNGELIKELTIDESADIRFSQNIKIAEDSKKYYGKWNYSVESLKAVGNYRLMISTR